MLVVTTRRAAQSTGRLFASTTHSSAASLGSSSGES